MNGEIKNTPSDKENLTRREFFEKAGKVGVKVGAAALLTGCGLREGMLPKEAEELIAPNSILVAGSDSEKKARLMHFPIEGGDNNRIITKVEEGTLMIVTPRDYDDGKGPTYMTEDFPGKPHWVRVQALTGDKQEEGWISTKWLMGVLSTREKISRFWTLYGEDPKRALNLEDLEGK